MPITIADIHSHCYDPINFTPRTVPTGGVGAAIKKFDPYDQVSHSVSDWVKMGPQNTKTDIRNLSFARINGGDSYYLPFQSDGICSVALPATPGVGEPTYFFTIRLTACAIYIDSYQPTAAAGYTTPLGAVDIRPRIIIHHANAVQQYQQGVVGVNVGANPTYFPMTAASALDNYHNTAKGTYPGVILNRRVLLKAHYNAAVEREVRRLESQGNTNVQYGSTTIVFGFYQPGGWQFYYQTWAAFDYDRPKANIKSLVGHSQVRETNKMWKYHVIDCRRFYP